MLAQHFERRQQALRDTGGQLLRSGASVNIAT
jgi:hypothetical protein